MAGEQVSEQLKYQTWVMKVFIHCKGCRRTVKKTLQSIEGVYETAVDPQQHKVTVTGNVDAETLIKRLAKIGKLAELWSEQSLSNNDKKKSKGSNEAGSETSENQEKKQPATDKAREKPIAKSETEHFKSKGKETLKPNVKESSNSPIQQAEKSSSSETGSGKKKKNMSGSVTYDNEATIEETNKVSNISGSGGSIGKGAKQHAVAQQLPFHTPPAAMQSPAYVMSYNTMQPSPSYGVSYYPMPVQQSSYIYSGHPVPAPYYYYQAPPPPPPLSQSQAYQMLEDENANSCVVM